MKVFGIPIEFVLFALTLLGVALLHRHSLLVALSGMTIIAGFKFGIGHFDWAAHWAHEWVVLCNLLGLLLGFSLLADHFEQSQLPALLPNVLPDDWRGGFVLLVLVFVLSAFLDNIAAAMIGGTAAATLYQRKVHIGFLAAIVAASNAGGAGSVVGDTTTTMMWIAGVSPWMVLKAYAAALPALLIFGVLAARQQHAHQAILKDNPVGVRLDTARLVVVGLILLFAVGVNITFNTHDKLRPLLDHWPVMGLAVWVAVLLTAAWRRPNWSLLPNALKGAVFLLALVVCASLMPVKDLPAPSWGSTLGLGFISALFDNIPLTALAIRQGHYDWGFLAYAVGFGGSMLWFGSSAGVALSNLYPEAQSVWAWVKGGWHIALAYVLGFGFLLLLGWQPTSI
jgi:Na+/H+ antiporter NhaD/arsenite permease-like protein